MSTPKRVQRRRTKGWRMPPNTVYVGRGTRWGNPWRVVVWQRVRGRAVTWCVVPSKPSDVSMFDDEAAVIRETVDRYRAWLLGCPYMLHEARKTLRGKDLACWCQLDQPCHADVLLELANSEALALPGVTRYAGARQSEAAGSTNPTAPEQRPNREATNA